MIYYILNIPFKPSLLNWFIYRYAGAAAIIKNISPHHENAGEK